MDIKPRVLLVDDVEDNCFIVKYYLEKAQCEVMTANNGLEAVEQFQNGRWDLIIMDIQMPVMDGWEATTAIRQIEKDNALPHTPIVALTASALTESREKCIAVGCDYFQTKPIKKTEIKEILSTFL